MTPALITQLFSIFAPIVQGIITRHRDATGQDPTPEEVVAQFQAHTSKYIAEGEAWLAAHPPTP